ncbi:hypothetical protein HAX54_032430 [Datura stramonium]|uniref:Uncharacterized protein n=1 Tax=Datura stramonium TaxID=4076 RepID=A0ABS8VD18_DATST|nr:hypothetical protein [Datura stramonium]
MQNICKSIFKDKEGKSKRKESLSQSSSQRSKCSKAKSGLRHSNCMNSNLIYVTGARSRPTALPKPIIISVPRPHCWKGSASKPYVELSPHMAPLGMEARPSPGLCG